MKRQLSILLALLLCASLLALPLQAGAAELSPEDQASLEEFLSWFARYDRDYDWKDPVQDLVLTDGDGESSLNILKSLLGEHPCADLSLYPGGSVQTVENEKDPQERWNGYRVFPAQQVDWILINVFNCAPEDLQLLRASLDGYDGAYFQDNCYFTPLWKEPDEIGQAKNVSAEAEGERYLVSFRYDHAPGSGADGKYQAILEKKTIDGTVYWSLYSFGQTLVRAAAGGFGSSDEAGSGAWGNVSFPLRSGIRTAGTQLARQTRTNFQKDRLVLEQALQGIPVSEALSPEPEEEAGGEIRPFFGIWCASSTEFIDAQAIAYNLTRKGFDAQVYRTSDWSNLSSRTWYAVTAGVYPTESAAQADLPDVQAIYGEAYVKYTGAYIGDGPTVEVPEEEIDLTSPFYGIWCLSTKDPDEARRCASTLTRNGYDGQVFVSTDWKGLNRELYYLVTAGMYGTRKAAQGELPTIRQLYPEAYVKYTGDYVGGTQAQPAEQEEDAPQTAPFYGVWCMATRDPDRARACAEAVTQLGYAGQVFVSSDWSELNPDRWYVVTAGIYLTETQARTALPGVRAYYDDAYVRYTGVWQGQE